MDAFPVNRDVGGYFGASSPVAPRSQPLRPVHRIGAYRCSVVPDVATLLTTVDWSAFDVAPDLESRLAVLHDTRVCPKGCGFVVAQAVEDVADDGFAVVYPGNDIMMPTCHEAAPCPSSCTTSCAGRTSNTRRARALT
jgi:hypothetical protein